MSQTDGLKNSKTLFDDSKDKNFKKYLKTQNKDEKVFFSPKSSNNWKINIFYEKNLTQNKDFDNKN